MRSDQSSLGSRVGHYHVQYNNRPFYSCVLSVLAWIDSEAGVDLVLIESLTAFLM